MREEHESFSCLVNYISREETTTISTHIGASVLLPDADLYLAYFNTDVHSV